jgi:hypothetical protein
LTSILQGGKLVARKRIKGLTLSEFFVILGVIGIFASIVMPSYIRFQSSCRIEQLLESARSCGEDLSLWLSTPISKEPLESVGATVAVTDEDRNGEVAYDGILAVYNVEPGTR